MKKRFEVDVQISLKKPVIVYAEDSETAARQAEAHAVALTRDLATERTAVAGEVRELVGIG